MVNSFKYKWLDEVMSTRAKPVTKNVAYVLFSMANKESICWPNLTLIDSRLGGTGHGKNIHRQINELVEMNFIKKTQVKVKFGMSSQYLLCLPSNHSESSIRQGECTDHQPECDCHRDDGLTI